MSFPARCGDRLRAWLLRQRVICSRPNRPHPVTNVRLPPRSDIHNLPPLVSCPALVTALPSVWSREAMLTLRSLRCAAIAARPPRALRALHSSVPASDSSAAPEPAQAHDALAAQAELAAKAKVLSPYHKVSFDERKVRIPWQDGMTSALYVALARRTWLWAGVV